MNALQMLLASNLMKKLPLYGFLAVGVILLIVFIVGMCKGFFRVSKGGIVWAITGVGFIALYKFMPNLLESTLSKTALKAHTQVVWGAALLVSLVVVMLLSRAILGMIFKPKAKAKAETKTESSEGYEYQLDDVVEEHYAEKPTKYEIKRRTAPGILSRLGGGVTALLNLAVVLAMVAAIGLFVINAFKIKGGVEGLIGGDLAEVLNTYLLPYVLDFLIVCIVLFVGKRGFYTGTIGLTRILLMKVGILAAIGFGLAAPFIGAVNRISIIATLIERCAGLYAKVSFVSPALLGKVTLGVLFAIVGVLAVVLLNLLLKVLIEWVESTTVLRIIDGIFATLIYLVLALGICAVLWGGLYVLDACELFRVQSLLKEGTFSFECFATAEKFLGKFVEQYLLRFAA